MSEKLSLFYEVVIGYESPQRYIKSYPSPTISQKTKVYYITSDINCGFRYSLGKQIGLECQVPILGYRYGRAETDSFVSKSNVLGFDFSYYPIQLGIQYRWKIRT